MSEHESTADRNKQLFRAICAELAEGKSTLLVDSLDDSVRWVAPGVTTWAKTFEGKRAVLTDFLRPVASRFGAPFRGAAVTLSAEEDRVVVELRGKGNITKNGFVYENAYCWVCRLRAGKIIEIVEYCDTELATRALGSYESLVAGA